MKRMLKVSTQPYTPNQMIMMAKRKTKLPTSSNTKRCKEVLLCLTTSKIWSMSASATQFQSTRHKIWAKNQLFHRKLSETQFIPVDSWQFKTNPSHILTKIATLSKSHNPRVAKANNRWMTPSSPQAPSKKLMKSQSSQQPFQNSNLSKRRTSTSTSENLTKRSSLASPSPSKRSECDWTQPMAILRLGRCSKLLSRAVTILDLNNSRCNWSRP